MGLAYDIYHAFRRVLFEPIYLLTGYTPAKYRLSAGETAFIARNSKHWEPLGEADAQTPLVLIYGHMGGEGVNYLSRLGMFGRAAAETLGATIRVVLPRCGYNSHNLICLFKSFGISDFQLLRSMDWNLALRFKAMFLALRWYLSAKSPDDIFALSFQGHTCGDIVYNDIIHERKNTHTVERIAPFVLPFVFRFYLHMLVYDRVLRRGNIQLVITTHTEYIMFGTLARLALLRKIPVIETTDNTTRFFTEDHLRSGMNFFSYTREYIQKTLESAENSFGLVARAEEELSMRVSGSLKQVESQLAYKGKQVPGEAELRALLGENSSRPIVSIFSHVFCDMGVEFDRSRIFRDYYQWLAYTLDAIVSITSTRWVLKPHPAQRQYGEYDEIRRLYEQALRRNPQGTISWCPDELSTKALLDCSTAFVTARGTIGLECSCFGKPAIVTGMTFYSDFGFTYEPRTLEEYIKLLNSAGTLPPLNQEQILAAKSVYGAYSTFGTIDENRLVDPEILNLVWGYGGVRDLDKAYAMAAENLQEVDPREQRLYSRAVDISRSIAA